MHEFKSVPGIPSAHPKIKGDNQCKGSDNSVEWVSTGIFFLPTTAALRFESMKWACLVFWFSVSKVRLMSSNVFYNLLIENQTYTS